MSRDLRFFNTLDDDDDKKKEETNKKKDNKLWFYRIKV